MAWKDFVIVVLWCLPFSLSADVATEPIPNVLSLPETYPTSWIFAHDVNSHKMIGKVIVLDLAAKSHHYKGVLQAAHFGNFMESERRDELYIAETVYSRGTYGTRTDLLVVYDKPNLTPLAEIILPGNKRGLMTAQKGLFQLTGDERLALVYNFTPGASVTVVGLDQRRVLNEVPVPGCSLIYPVGERSFFSLCGNGAMVTLRLDGQGKVVSETVSRVFNDIDNDPLFMKSAVVNGNHYYPSYRGRLQPISMELGDTQILPSWSLVTEEADIAESWRPSGWQLISADSAGHLYILMRKNAIDGTHNSGGGEVWVYDISKQRRIRRIVLREPGFSIEVTRGKQPYLAVTNLESSVDVYDANRGEFIRSIGGWSGTFPMVLHAAK